MPRAKTGLVEKPHWVEPEEGHLGYYRLFLNCSDNEVVCGTGRTPTEARSRAFAERRKHEKLLATPAEEQLRKLIRKEMLHSDMERAIKLLAKLVLRRV